jgi:predicted ATPase with chaperone activity
MSTTARGSTVILEQPLLAALLAGERFWPTEPQSLQETGLTEPFLEALACKFLLVHGASTGRNLANGMCLPFTLIESVLGRLRTQRLVTHRGAGPLNDYIYVLSEEGHRRAQAFRQECAYVGPAPVPLVDYVTSVDAQAIDDEPIRRSDLMDAFHDVSVPPDLLDLLGPAVNSAAGLFLYGAPGNGKSTLAHRITCCFGQEIWLPFAFILDQEIVKVYDPAYHHQGISGDDATAAGQSCDRRWVRVGRPTVVVGGELDMASLEIRHDLATNISEAPLQLKSNCGCLLIDDFGRQRVSPAELLNRWIIPLENRHDFLTLGTGKKIKVPFEQLIIFSTNLDPADLVDEAFLRRIPYRIEIGNPNEQEFHDLFQLVAEKTGCRYDPDAVEYLLEKHYRPTDRPLRRCHPRDLLLQIRHFCTYYDLPYEMLPQHFDRVARSFFTVLRTKDQRGDPLSPTGKGSDGGFG